MAFRRLQPGDALKIRAEDWNRLADMVEAPRRGDLSSERRNANARTYVTVVNEGSITIPEGTVVMLGEPLIGSDQKDYRSMPMFRAKVPYADKPCALGVTLAPVNPQETGVAVVTGCVPVVCNVGSRDDTRIKPDGNGGCVTAKEGPIQLAYAPGTGMQWCYAILGGGGAGDQDKGTGPFDVILGVRKDKQEDGTEKEVPAVICRNTSLPADTTQAGIVKLGNSRLFVNAMTADPIRGYVILDVYFRATTAEDGTARHELAGEVRMEPDIPTAREDERRYVLRLADVWYDGAWHVGMAREPGDVEILGRWA